MSIERGSCINIDIHISLYTDNLINLRYKTTTSSFVLSASISRKEDKYVL
jgi:hypothetical protein